MPLRVHNLSFLINTESVSSHYLTYRITGRECMIKLTHRILNRVLKIWKDKSVEDMYSKLMLVNPLFRIFAENMLVVVGTLCCTDLNT